MLIKINVILKKTTPDIKIEISPLFLKFSWVFIKGAIKNKNNTSEKQDTFDEPLTKIS